MRKVTALFVALFLMSLAALAQHSSSNHFGVPAVQYNHPVQTRISTPLEDSAATEVAFIPKGPGGVHYRGDSPGSEMLPQGPAALAVDSSGGFWLLDTVAGHVLHLESNGVVVADFDLSRDLIHGAALSVQRVGKSQVERIAIYDLGAHGPQVLQYDLSGKQVSQVNLPSDWASSLNKITLNGDGSVDAFLVAGANVGRYRVTETHGGVSYVKMADPGRMLFGYWGIGDDPTGEWSDQIRPVDPDNVPAEKEYLGSSANGDRFFRVGEFAGDAEGNMYVDVTIQRFRRDGSFSGIARVPVREQYVPVESNDGLALDSYSGNVYVLVPESTGASIRQLVFAKRLTPLGPIMRHANTKSSKLAGITKSIGTNQMIAESNSYCTSAVTVPAAAVPNDASTPGRTQPLYMTTSGSYGVPYSYGGFEDRPNFATHMSQATTSNHYKAGDVDTSQQISYSGTGASQWTGYPYFGVDCSGFVSRCWGLSSKESTTSLLNYVLNACPATFQQGDIMDLPGTHVRMYIDSTTSPSSTGYYLYAESAGDPHGVQIAPYTISSQVSYGYSQYRFSGATSTGYSATVASCPP